LFVCPVCRERLSECDNSLKCPVGHTFDKSGTGDVFLLRTSKGIHGDSREMVTARRDFLELGYYSFLADALAQAAVRYAPSGEVNYFDAGCGTGYYTEAVSKALSRERAVNTVGVDISKHAVKLSAKRVKNGEFATASVYDLPLADESFDVITNVFSPMAEGEFKRILKPRGVLLYAVPAPRHLYSMKKVLYENPYENEEKNTDYEGFSHIEKIAVSSSARLKGKELSALFAMTPYYWRTSEEGATRLGALDELEVEFSFFVHVYERIGE
jgi:23S rRNA (guanine745-N1)-methyltransferase